jgi:excisionase family DNA binding protein
VKQVRLPEVRLDALRLLTVPDVAQRLQVSERAVRRWIAEGRLPAVRLGRAVRIRPADLAQLITTGLTD